MSAEDAGRIQFGLVDVSTLHVEVEVCPSDGLSPNAVPGTPPQPNVDPQQPLHLKSPMEAVRTRIAERSGYLDIVHKSSVTIANVDEQIILLEGVKAQAQAAAADARSKADLLSPELLERDFPNALSSKTELSVREQHGVVRAWIRGYTDPEFSATNLATYDNLLQPNILYLLKAPQFDRSMPTNRLYSLIDQPTVEWNAKRKRPDITLDVYPLNLADSSPEGDYAHSMTLPVSELHKYAVVADGIKDYIRSFAEAQGQKLEGLDEVLALNGVVKGMGYDATAPELRKSLQDTAAIYFHNMLGLYKEDISLGDSLRQGRGLSDAKDKMVTELQTLSREAGFEVAWYEVLDVIEHKINSTGGGHAAQLSEIILRVYERYPKEPLGPDSRVVVALANELFSEIHAAESVAISHSVE